MLADDEPLSSPLPFWFASEELLTDLLGNEVNMVTQLLAKYSDFRNLFDAPDTTVSQRTACFTLLGHRKVMEMIYETFAGRYEVSPSLGEMESHAISCTNNLIATDAPAWALEVYEVVEHLPSHIYNALPEPLRLGGFAASDPARAATIKSAAETISSVEQIQVLTGGVLDQQLRRLEQRWSATLTTIVQVRQPIEPEPNRRETNKRKARRTQDKRRVLRDRMIAEIDDIAETIPKFLQMMDERKVKPQPTWNDWPGSWVKAYMNPHLRDLIHKDKSRSLSRVRSRSNR